ncbi:MAG: MIP/aquaporin family protein [Thermoplasmata archaeon]
MRRTAAVRCAAELGGTALLVGIGTGAIVAAARFGGVPQGVMALAWFAAVLLPIWLFIRVSGAHLNPVVTVALALSGRIALREAPAYWVGQFTGAFVGSLTVWGLLGNAAHLGATTPSIPSLVGVFLSEAAFTALLVATVFCLSDFGEGGGRWRLLLPPLAVGLATWLIGPWTGSSLNLARSLAPAVLSSTYSDLWVYFVANIAGGLVVALFWRPRTVDRLDRGPGRPSVSS